MFKIAMLYFGCNRGATAIEYTFIAAGIGLSIFAALFLIGADFGDILEAINEAMSNALEETAVEE
ncbi:MAG TPA: hypothetical protein EYG18_07585 [Micavibrio sp.]|jgi:Flp pilus assembly pilin Flp|nr:hypothetical protein [Pseudomonadota bacterium]MEC8665621.1 hypothetical protein [Pseudomonadota bacterium]HIF26005.1 hypothetical protein [Micavibrio sp.]HIL29115.1 hypothetical protein [Micavibrio sp.]